MTAVDSAATPAPALVTVRFDRVRLAVTGIVVAQAIWLWVLIGRGWYLQADFSNLADAQRSGLGWSYLREPLGGHFAPVLRLLYSMLDRIGTLDYTVTVALRVGLQAAGTLVLYRVLRTLAGRTTLVLTVVTLYSFSPLLLPGLAWLSSGMGLALGQLLALLGVDRYLAYTRTGRLRPAAAAGALLAVATLCADQWIVAVLIPPILALGYVYTGAIGRRLRAFVQNWRAWSLILGPVAVAAALAAILADTTGTTAIGFDAGYHLLRDEWLRAVGPAFVGGPWSWFGDSRTYAPFLLPPDEARLLGQIAFVVLVLLGFERTRWRSLAGWSLPLAVVVVGTLLIGVGRYDASGLLIAITPRYSFQVVAPLAMGIVLALSDPVLGQEQAARPPGASRWAVDRPRLVLISAATALVGIMSIVSSLRFSTRWAANPADEYVAALVASVRAAGPDVNLYDTPVPSHMISVVEPHHHLSDLLRLAGVSARFDDPRTEPLVATPTGRLSKATFLSTATGAGPQQPNCGTHIKGKGSWTIPLTKPARPQEWFLRLELYQAVPSVVDIDVADEHGAVRAPVTGSTVALPRLAAINLRLPFFAPAAVHVRSDSATTDLCLVHVRVGGPFAPKVN